MEPHTRINQQQQQKKVKERKEKKNTQTQTFINKSAENIVSYRLKLIQNDEMNLNIDRNEMKRKNKIK